MPRPHPAQLAYGSAAVVLSALAMLLVPQARSGAGVVVVACAALALGLLVALRIPAGRTEPDPRTVRETPPTRPGHRGAARAGDDPRVPQPSLRR